MSARTGLRASSRRTTPQSSKQVRAIISSAPEQRDRRNTRTTRSASRDVSDVETGVSNTERSARGTKSKIIARKSGPKKERPIRTAPHQDLSIVIEAPEVAEEVEEDLAQNYGQEPEQEQEESNQASSHRVSGISGTTARDSNSAQELARLRVDEMQDVLPDLASTAEKILDFVLQYDISEAALESLSKSLQDKNSKESRTLRRMIPGYQAQKVVYGIERYIDKSIAINGLLTSQLFSNAGDGPWRPDEIIYLANLAQLVVDLLSTPPEERLSFLEDLERDYPNQFMLRLLKTRKTVHGTGCSAHVKLTFECGIHLRTQLFLLRLHKHSREPDFNPLTCLEELFYSHGGFKGFDIDGLRTEELSDKHKRLTTDVSEELKAFLDQGSDVEMTDSGFPWSEMVVKLVSWAAARKEEIELRLNLQGGAEGVQNALLVERKRREGLQAAELSSAEQKKRLSAILYMKSKTFGTRPSSVIEHNGDDELFVASGIGAKAKGPKARAFIDPQENAERITFDTQTSNDADSGTSTSKRKRSPARDAEEEDNNYVPSEDEGFQTDNRPHLQRFTVAVNDKPSAVIPAPQRPRKRRRADEQSTVEQGTVEQSTVEQGTGEQSTGEQNERSSPPFDFEGAIDAGLQQANQPPPRSQFEESMAASQEAILRRKLKVKPTQTRHPWTDAENDALIKYVGRHGIGWAAIKEADSDPKKPTRHRLTGRDQVALRDRARNIKIGFLRGKKPLPKNFNLVPLKASDIANLRKYRDDVDALLAGTVDA